MISAAESCLMEGKKEGELKTQLEIIQNLLGEGIDWNVIFKATGIDQVGFQKLKKEWSLIEASS